MFSAVSTSNAGSSFLHLRRSFGGNPELFKITVHVPLIAALPCSMFDAFLTHCSFPTKLKTLQKTERSITSLDPASAAQIHLVPCAIQSVLVLWSAFGGRVRDVDVL